MLSGERPYITSHGCRCIGERRNKTVDMLREGRIYHQDVVHRNEAVPGRLYSVSQIHVFSRLSVTIRDMKRVT